MSFLNRYFFYTVAFAIVIAALISHSYALLVSTIVLGVLIGLMTEYFDNKRTVKYKHYNATKHNYKH